MRNKGCAGLSYHLEYVDKPGKFDEVVEQDGVKVLIDSKALFSIIGSEMDWKEDGLRYVARVTYRGASISSWRDGIVAPSSRSTTRILRTSVVAESRSRSADFESPQLWTCIPTYNPRTSLIFTIRTTPHCIATTRLIEVHVSQMIFPPYPVTRCCLCFSLHTKLHQKSPSSSGNNLPPKNTR